MNVIPTCHDGTHYLLQCQSLLKTTQHFRGSARLWETGYLRIIQLFFTPKGSWVGRASQTSMSKCWERTFLIAQSSIVPRRLPYNCCLSNHTSDSNPTNLVNKIFIKCLLNKLGYIGNIEITLFLKNTQ